MPDGHDKTIADNAATNFKVIDGGGKLTSKQSNYFASAKPAVQHGGCQAHALHILTHDGLSNFHFCPPR